MTPGRRMLAMLIAAAMIEMIVRVNDVRYLLGPKSGQLQLGRDGLRRALRRISPRNGVANVFDIEAGIEEKFALLMIDENAIDGEAIRAAQSGVQEHVGPI